MRVSLSKKRDPMKAFIWWIVSLLECGIKPVVVFDGEPSQLKKQQREETILNAKKRVRIIDGVVSHDIDSMVFGARRIIRQLNFKDKVKGSVAELIETSQALASLNLSKEELIQSKSRRLRLFTNDVGTPSFASTGCKDILAKKPGWICNVSWKKYWKNKKRGVFTSKNLLYRMESISIGTVVVPSSLSVSTRTIRLDVFPRIPPDTGAKQRQQLFTEVLSTLKVTQASIPAEEFCMRRQLFHDISHEEHAGARLTLSKRNAPSTLLLRST
eukprot:g78571.t1